MLDAIDSFERRADRRRIEQVAYGHLDAGRGGVDADVCELARIAHQQPHAVAALDRLPRDVRADETRRTGDQRDRLVHVQPFWARCLASRFASATIVSVGGLPQASGIAEASQT